VAEAWINWDALGLMQQLGVLPSAEAAPKPSHQTPPAPDQQTKRHGAGS
jgi:hypothetical protein